MMEVLETCGHCQRTIEPGVARLCVHGTIAWTGDPAGKGDPIERAIEDASARFCSIRCLGTFLGVLFEDRGLTPPKGA